MMYKQQHIDHFIGRSQEISTFVHWLTNPISPWILYIHDAAEEANKKGGVGKTWLLRRCAELTRQRRQDTTAVVVIDFFNVGDRDGILLAEKIMTNLQEIYPVWSPSTFTEAIQQYRIEERQIADSGSSESAARDIIFAALVEDLHLLNEHLAKTQKTLVVFFDTFELIEQNPGVAVLRQSQTFPDNYQLERMKVVIAGRNKLDWTHPNWIGREQEVQVMPLAPFSLQEMQEYVKAELIYDFLPQSRQAHALYERTEGRPILIGLAIDVLNNRIQTIDDLISVAQDKFEAYLVPQVNRLENPLNWVILFMAHVYHRFNIPIFESILQSVALDSAIQTINRETLLSILPQLSFVRQAGSSEDFVLHDEMRRLVTRYCWEVQDPDQRFRKAISSRVIEYYEQELTHIPNEQQRQIFIVETLYHRLYVDLDDGLPYFQQHFYSALRLRNTSFARLLFQEVQKFSSLLSPAQLNDLHYAEAVLLRTEENVSAALEILHRLKNTADPQWYEENQPLVLTQEGRCYQRQSKFLEATNSFMQCLEIQRSRGDELQCAHLLNNLGVIFRRSSQFATALKYYEESIALYKKLGRQSDYATALNGSSTVYRLQGKTEEALRRCKIAWRIRRDLFREDKVSEVQIGLSLDTLGRNYLDAGNIINAEQYFKEAFDIYLRANYKGGIATIYNRFGLVQLAKGELESAREWFARAQHASQEIDAEQYIDSLNQQGEICIQLQKKKEATVFFEQAITYARRAIDYYQQVENLIGLAKALDPLEQGERIQQVLQEAEDIATRESYFNLLGQIEQTRGEISYYSKEYSTAFLHFARYCHHMAIYNATEFKVAVRQVVDALLGIPTADVPLIAQELLTYWSTQQLDTKYPEFMLAFGEIDNLMEV
ncbi:MAG TPA: tetratricopeptide repeat protein [Ktedonosporobacter sp.]|jgi:tetratricopeptide (TPR) repeat protein|nr:tetratricopeptide repeat protein [Ktedonosporobacter sp.]